MRSMANDSIGRWLSVCSSGIREIPIALVPMAILVASALTLFAELSVVRLHNSHIPIFALLKNLSILSCFLGLGAGYALSGRERLYFPLFPLFWCNSPSLPYDEYICLEG